MLAHRAFFFLLVAAAVAATTAGPARAGSTGSDTVAAVDCSLLSDLTSNGFQYHVTRIENCYNTVQATFEAAGPSFNNVNITFLFSSIVNGSTPDACSSGKRVITNAVCNSQTGLTFALDGKSFAARVYRSPCDASNPCLNPVAATCNETVQGGCSGGEFISKSSSDVVISIVSSDTTTEISVLGQAPSLLRKGHHAKGPSPQQAERKPLKSSDSSEQFFLTESIPNICGLLKSGVSLTGYFTGIDSSQIYPTPAKQCLSTITSSFLKVDGRGYVSGSLTFTNTTTNIPCISGVQTVTGICTSSGSSNHTLKRGPGNDNDNANSVNVIPAASVLRINIGNFAYPFQGGAYSCPRSCVCGVNSCLAAMTGMCVPNVPVTGQCSAGLLKCCANETVVGLHYGVPIIPSPAGGSLDYTLSLIAAGSPIGARE